MAHNAYQFTITPAIPNDVLCDLEGHILMEILGNEPDDGPAKTYFFCEDGSNDVLEITDDLIAFMDDATGPIADAVRNHVDVESNPGDEIYLDEIGISYVDVLQALVDANPSRLPQVEIQGCWYCSKMRPGEFGGFAVLITPGKIEQIDTMQWLRQHQPAQAAA